MSEKKYAFFWEKEYKEWGDRKEPIVKANVSYKGSLYYAGAFIGVSLVLGEAKHLHSQGALFNPVKMVKHYAERIKSAGKSTKQSGKRLAVKTRDGLVYIGNSTEKMFKHGLDYTADKLDALDDLYRNSDDFFVENIKDPIADKALSTWADIKAKSRRVKITIRGNNKNEVSIFANKIKMISQDKDLESYFTNTVVPAIPDQDYFEFPVNDKKLSAMFKDKKIYMQNSVRPNEGPFYQIEVEFNAKYIDTLKWKQFLKDIFKTVAWFNEHEESKYEETYGNFGVQIIIESV